MAKKETHDASGLVRSLPPAARNSGLDAPIVVSIEWSFSARDIDMDFSMARATRLATAGSRDERETWASPLRIANRAEPHRRPLEPTDVTRVSPARTHERLMIADARAELR